MVDCKGLFGKWFGHKYVTMTLSEKRTRPDVQLDLSIPGMNGDPHTIKDIVTLYHKRHKELIESLSDYKRVNKIVCKRCGHILEVK